MISVIIFPLDSSPAPLSYMRGGTPPLPTEGRFVLWASSLWSDVHAKPIFRRHPPRGYCRDCRERAASGRGGDRNGVHMVQTDDVPDGARGGANATRTGLLGGRADASIGDSKMMAGRRVTKRGVRGIREMRAAGEVREKRMTETRGGAGRKRCGAGR